MKNRKTEYIITVIGMVLLIGGVYAVKTIVNPEGVLKALPYVCIGFGCGLFGQGMGSIISKKAMKNSPEIQRKLEIEKKDERNIMLVNRAKAKAFDRMTFIFGALMVSYALMETDMVAIVLLVFAYLWVHGSAIYYRCKYDKEM